MTNRWQSNGKLRTIPAMKKLPPLLLSLFISASLWAQEYRITGVDGQAALIPKGSTMASPAVKGVTLQGGDRLITGNGGRVEIAAKQGTVLELKEKSYFRIQNLAAGKSSFYLKMGRLLARFAPSSQTGTTYRVRTPTVVAAVRGTELGVAVADNGGTEGGVIEGRVDFKKSPDDPKAVMSWSDEDPRLEEDVIPAEAGIQSVNLSSEATGSPIKTFGDDSISVGPSEGIAVKPNGMPEKLPGLPPVIVSDLAWFTSVRERVPKLRDEWKDLDVPSQMKLRQQALRERITWEIPAKLNPAKAMPSKPAPEKISPKKKDIPKPR